MKTPKTSQAAARLPSPRNQRKPPEESNAHDAQILAASHNTRLSRVVDYQLCALAKDDPLEANLGSINGGLMRVAHGIEEIIEQAMVSGPRTVERLQDLMPAIDTYLRVTRQVDRFAQTELRAAAARSPKVDEIDAMLAIPLSEAKIDQSEDSGL